MSDSFRWWRRRLPREDDTPPPTAAPAPAGPRGERVKTVAVRLTPAEYEVWVAEYEVWVAATAADGRGQLGGGCVRPSRSVSPAEQEYRLRETSRVKGDR